MPAHAVNLNQQGTIHRACAEIIDKIQVTSTAWRILTQDYWNLNCRKYSSIYSLVRQEVQALPQQARRAPSKSRDNSPDAHQLSFGSQLEITPDVTEHVTPKVTDVTPNVTDNVIALKHVNSSSSSNHTVSECEEQVDEQYIMSQGVSIADPDQPSRAFIRKFAEENDSIIKKICTSKR